MTIQLKEKIDILEREKSLTTKELRRLLVINDPWAEVRGILKNKKISALAYQKKMRRELER
ncbi:MAG: hypothetical protein COZ31_05840 [Nitrospirae bacterium CG_4_10_14_3_um_filter_44_29]|nr:MAG: hypothetical protein AUJ60_05840 [Nitrospirae bacterium CG1_02_44_142]PIP70917.1 MAG: hypothetical protein COW90_02780 [Nitrospirae bacterium CG22_combo_CG10-13_8_21_14_all_44_11]PIV40882.1 MAG: hypothetical protein COS28_06670 [Nitrospirae bacterium CG02_land_8_20_14_3_00_44_33]PIV67302.1 MAG: hypothetical protein COS10_01745 [Nitrospirae bacterium CG01_land_8_20_14_3_00_44_22]PIW89207.1 MAG: hypothetical protein COZ93_06235 [Nitrospirae bacterium CG_4_8_14_3_um_filter_44_28]PIX88653.